MGRLHGNRQGIYYLAPDSMHGGQVEYVIRPYRFADGTQLVASLGDRPSVVGVDVSPDGSYLLFTRNDPFGSDLYPVENLR